MKVIYTEQLEWMGVEEGERPHVDAEATMLLKLADGEVWQGYWDDEAGCWCDVHGSQLAGRVLAFCDPVGPEVA